MPHYRVHRYRRMNGGQLRAALDQLEMHPAYLAFLTGVREDRIGKWLHGVEDIPPYVPVFLAMLTLPAARAMAINAAAHQLEDST